VSAAVDTLIAVQIQADALLALLGIRMQAGQIVFHVGEYRVQKVETNAVFKLKDLTAHTGKPDTQR
jgi:hypothetical protein